MKKLSQHTEWLSFLETSGPFLTVSMLEKVFPQGLDAVETPKRQRIRAAYEEWREAVDEDDPLLPALHQEWVRLVLTELLEYDNESLTPARAWPGELLSVSSHEHAGTFTPDWLVHSPVNKTPRLFISVLPPEVDLEVVRRGDAWPVSFQERMTLLCRTYGVRLGLLTNGERWMLVNAPVGLTSGQASWYSRLWFQEPLTLKAFRSLLGVRRCFGQTEETLEALLEESLKYQEEVTNTLGEQVRHAVEVLVQCLDKADEDRNRELLHDVTPAELYEAGLTVMMRLVFVLCAEERDLLLSGDPVYDQCYAVSTLRGQLEEEVDRNGPEVLDRRYDAWARLLAIFRAIYGGIEHEALRMPALGGSLFDPDRFSFLEGRSKGTCWRDSSAIPLPIDNRTVLLLLTSLQILEQPGGALLLSYKALDVEQIGHVYEGLLEHTASRVPKITLGLQGSQKAKNPNVFLAELESARLDGDGVLIKRILKVTGRSESAVKNALKKTVDETFLSKVQGVCGGDATLVDRIRHFANLLRMDAWEDPIVYQANSFIVTLGADRRETGTHYTPKSLTENIVITTLEPIVYRGPAEGKSREEWALKTSQEILGLKVCDPAMGSGAFLVQACRYLGERLVEAWLYEEKAGKTITVDGEAFGELGTAEPMPSQLDERLTIARRLVAERCLYGVDINPLAVELAKLSIWLVTLAKGRPFGFLDHNLRSGDSLLGIHRLEQLTYLTMNPESGQYQLRLFGQKIKDAVQKSIELRKQLRAIPIRDIRDVENMVHLDQEAREKLAPVKLIADAMIGEIFHTVGNGQNVESILTSLATRVEDYMAGNKKVGEQIAHQAKEALAIDLPVDKPKRRPFHWALEFPEVFEQGGFDGIISNPPFMGGQKITGNLGVKYRDFLVSYIANGKKGSADICSYFLLRTSYLLAKKGIQGFTISSAISEGDTRSVGLEQVLNIGCSIINVKTKIVWPGKANVTITLIWMFNGSWKGHVSINGDKVFAIDSTLSACNCENITTPYKLLSNKKMSFQGSIPLGKGFILTIDEVESIISKNSQCSEVIYSYLTGQELNIEPKHQPSQWIINFQDWPLDVSHAPYGYKGPLASDYPECLEIVRNKVKPERDKVNRKVRREKWWQYAERAKGLYSAIKDLDWCLAIATQATKYVAFGQVSGKNVYSNAIAIIASDDYALAASLSSSIHEIWARRYASYNLLLLRYSPSDLFETFPLPKSNPTLREIGQLFFKERSKLMNNNKEGLTETYNRLNSPLELSYPFVNLRKIISQMDIAVTEAYEWTDIDLKHNFYETEQGIRFTISENARKETLQRLLELNSQMYKDIFD